MTLSTMVGMSSLALHPIDRARRAAHRTAVQSEISHVTADLQKVLGQALIAVIVNKDVRTVARWTAATPAKPSTRDNQRLRDALQVQQLLLTADAPDVVRAWFMGMNPQLNDLSPVEALAEGRAREVMAAARAFVNAG